MNNITKNQNKLIDPFGRDVNYLRVSVTDRCDFRCTYCMAEDMQFLPKKDILSLEEIEDICRTFMKLGTRKIRLTGGEPLVRKGIMQVINNLGKEVGTLLDELTITTNGSQLESKAEELYRAGVRRINVSLDHLDPVKFKEITRWGDLDKVKRGLKNEEIILRSTPLIYETVEQLGFDISYYVVGNIKTTETFEDIPFKVHKINPSSVLAGEKFTINFINNQKFEIIDGSIVLSILT